MIDQRIPKLLALYRDPSATPGEKAAAAAALERLGHPVSDAPDVSGFDPDELSAAIHEMLTRFAAGMVELQTAFEAIGAAARVAARNIADAEDKWASGDWPDGPTVVTFDVDFSDEEGEDEIEARRRLA